MKVRKGGVGDARRIRPICRIAELQQPFCGHKYRRETRAIEGERKSAGEVQREQRIVRCLPDGKQRILELKNLFDQRAAI